MNKHEQLLSKNTDTTDEFQKSLEKFKNFERLVNHIMATTTLVERVKFLGWVLSGKSHVAHQQHLALARVAGVTVPTAYNWCQEEGEGHECTKSGRLYAIARIQYCNERDMARAFGEFINRDLLKELGL